MAQAEPVTPGAPRRIVFSSGQLPTALDDRGRRNLWRDLYRELCGPLDIEYTQDRPFSARLEFTHLGRLELSNISSAGERLVRTPRCIATADSDDLALVINRGSAPMLVHQKGREALLTAGAMALVCNATSGAITCGADNGWLFVQAPRRQLMALVGDAEDLVSMSLDRGQPAMRHLRRYLDILLEPDGLEDDALLSSHIETTLIDLMALVLGAGRDAAVLASMRGLRAARLQSIMAAIRTAFDDPDFSIHAVAAQVGLSPRYVQDLLHETGASFTERVLEQRLQKARTMLTGQRFAGYKIIDIALASGFNEASHFNRSFRRRFDASPSDMRARVRPL
jgi:AraC-like DNA-binding protein